MDFLGKSLSRLSGDGRLLLTAKWNAEENRVHSGAVRSAADFSGGYGYYEASIRFPKTYGIWGAFWMMAGDVMGEDNSSEDGIEIDIIESIDSAEGRCGHAIHWDGYGEKAKNDSKIHSNSKIYDGKFHKFALWRTETDYIFYVDGKETWRTRSAGICPLGGDMLLMVESAPWAEAGRSRPFKPCLRRWRWTTSAYGKQIPISQKQPLWMTVSSPSGCK